jgi:SNF2 family DNA or RNA helicase
MTKLYAILLFANCDSNKSNWYHVVITSYQLAVQDAFAFKRKRWYYLVLDEAQNIKNFQSQRWQTLINFNTQRRLLLTGTPLQVSVCSVQIINMALNLVADLSNS